MVLFLGLQISIDLLELFPKRVPIELSRDDQTDFAQEERLGPCWTMVWAICVSVDVSKYLDILTLELKKKTVVHLSF